MRRSAAALSLLVVLAASVGCRQSLAARRASAEPDSAATGESPESEEPTAVLLDEAEAEQFKKNIEMGLGGVGLAGPSRVRALSLLGPVVAGSLVRGPRRVGYLEEGWDGDTVHRVSSSGLEVLPGATKQLAKHRCSDALSAICEFAEGHAFIQVTGRNGNASSRARATRLLPNGSRSIAVGNFFGAVAMHDDREAWLVADHGISRLAFIDGRNKLRRTPAPKTLGPRVVGLSPAGRAACARPSHWKIAPSDDGVVALVMECDLEAPLRVQRYSHDGQLIEEVTLPSLATQGVFPHDFAALPDGRAVVLGRGEVARWGVERPDQTWEYHEGAGPADASIYDALVAADGALWFISWGKVDPETSARQIQRDGMPVELPTVDGVTLSPLHIAFDATLGVVAQAVVDGGAESYLFVENKPVSAG